MVLIILLGNTAHSLKVELISNKIGLVFSAMEHDMRELFCCLARDCNYCDEQLCDADFKSGLFCMTLYMFSKLLEVSEVF